MVVITVSAPGKTILHGEHAVVYGKAAVAVSLGLRTAITLDTDNNSSLLVRLMSLNYLNEWKLPAKILPDPSVDSVTDVIPSSETYLKNVLKLFPADFVPGSMTEQAVTALLFLYSAMTQKYRNGIPKGASVTLSSELPIGAGLGSSGSFSVVLSAAFLCLYGQIEPSPTLSEDHLKLISSWAFQAERIIHGKPSGIDNSICTFGSALLFQNGQITERISQLPEIKILLINTEVPRNTKLLVANVRDKVNKYPEVLEPILQSMEAISLKQWDILKKITNLNNTTTIQNGLSVFVVLNVLALFFKILMIVEGKALDLVTVLKYQQLQGQNVCPESTFFQDLVSMNHHLLNCIGVGHSKVEEICQIANSFNLPAKLTGAGGGGSVLVFLSQDANQSEVTNAFQDKGFKVYDADLGGKGVCFT